MTLSITVHAAARSRAHGPTAALWHAVEMHRPTSELDGACELTLCGVLARVTTGDGAPTPGATPEGTPDEDVPGGTDRPARAGDDVLSFAY